MTDTDVHTPTDISRERVDELADRLDDFGSSYREAEAATVLRVQSNEIDRLRTALDEATAERDALKALVVRMREALSPLADLKVPNRPQGNAGAYSIFHKDIERALAAFCAVPADLADCVVVPREPTEAMLMTCISSKHPAVVEARKKDILEDWRAMLKEASRG